MPAAPLAGARAPPQARLNAVPAPARPLGRARLAPALCDVASRRRCAANAAGKQQKRGGPAADGSPFDLSKLGFNDKWTARILPDDDYDDEYEGRREEAEDPATVLMAKEKFLGRIALISLGAVLLSERLSGRGIVTALNMATGVPVWEIEPALGVAVGALLAVAFWPVLARAFLRYKANQQGTTLNEKWTLGDSFQVATGRLACLTMAGTVLAEATTGKGILALLNIETGVEITEIEAGLTFVLLLLFTEDVKGKKK